MHGRQSVDVQVGDRAWAERAGGLQMLTGRRVDQNVITNSLESRTFATTVSGFIYTTFNSELYTQTYNRKTYTRR